MFRLLYSRSGVIWVPMGRFRCIRDAEREMDAEYRVFEGHRSFKITLDNGTIVSRSRRIECLKYGLLVSEVLPGYGLGWDAIAVS